MTNNDIKIIRYDEANQNIEAIKGQYAQFGDKKGTFTIIKNLLFINLLNGAKYDNVKLPEIYDGFIQCSNGTRVQVKESTLTCSLPSGVNGFGIFVLKKWN
jgi:hypothetical protein